MRSRSVKIASFRCISSAILVSRWNVGAGKHLNRASYSTSTAIEKFMPEVKEMDPTISNYTELYKFSINKPDIFWSHLARSRLDWFQPFTETLTGNFKSGQIQWFGNGLINASVNCVDRHHRRTPNKIALIWEKDEPGQQESLTFDDLYKLMNKIANVLKSHGVKRGDRVALYIPNSPMAVASMLACARIGAVQTVVFAGFSAEALASRIQDAGAETVITADHAIRGGKLIDLKATVDQALKNCPSVRNVFVYERSGKSVPLGKLDVPLLKALSTASDECEAEQMASNDTLFMLYTSGSTGKPKGLAHSTAGYLLYATVACKYVFDLRENDIFGCVADVGWITGHSAIIYGPLANGVTSLVFESTPTYPDPGRYWEMADRLKLTQMYCAPTALRVLIKHGDDWVKKYSRRTLRLLACVGEPINKPAWDWYHDVVGEGRCDVVDTWWQTETGAMCLTPRPSEPNAPVKPAMPMRPMLGIEPALLDSQGKRIEGEGEATGALCLAKPWPGMAQTIWGSHSRFIDTYLAPYPGYYFSGDEAQRDADGHYSIVGRMDDVINITGHRLGTAEVEEALCQNELVAEAAVVGFPDSIKGEAIYAFVTLKDAGRREAGDELTTSLRRLVKKNIAGYAVPDHIQYCESLPKTRSGKIMRRILRKIAANQVDDLGDISTLADPSVVEDLIKHKKNPS